MIEPGALAAFAESMWLAATDDIPEEDLAEWSAEAIYRVAVLNTLQMVEVMPARLRRVLTDEAMAIKEMTG